MPWYPLPLELSPHQARILRDLLVQHVATHPKETIYEMQRKADYEMILRMVDKLIEQH